MHNKTIKIKFINFWGGFNDNDNFIINVLRKRYNVVLSDKPDYLITSVFGKPYEYMLYDCIRILYTGEPFSPDFNVFDYAIGFDDITIKDDSNIKNKGKSDRYLRFPLGTLYIPDCQDFLCECDEYKARDILKRKTKFCNFIYGHRSYLGRREEIFDALNKYKHIDSAGSYMNNQPNGTIVAPSQKIDFIKNYKFSIAAESVSYPGFMTEKIIQAFQGYTIPIYYGDPNIKNDINEKSFINVSDYGSLGEVAEMVKAIDNDDNLYISYLMQNKEAHIGYFKRKRQELESFLFSIFDQDVEDARRRIGDYWPYWHGKYLKDYNYCYKRFLPLRLVRKAFKRESKGIFV